jgi:type III secretory pathway lipoprotein EscJ
VIPQNDPLAEENKVASASVFIKHRIDVDLQPMLPATAVQDR